MTARHRMKRRIAAYVELSRSGTQAFWLGVRRWFVVSAIVGATTGLLVSAVEFVVYQVLWRAGERAGDQPLVVFALPLAGLFLSGVALRYLTTEPDVHGTEEVIEAFHRKGGRVDWRQIPGKLLAAVATLGSGGSAGLEGPSIYVGGAVGSVGERAFRRLGFGRADLKTMTLAGAAAGISAIFKAPLTGIIFALEAPYRDDLAHEALVPSLVSSVTSYMVLVSLLGSEPLFYKKGAVGVRYEDLLVSTVLGVAVGLVARVFVWAFQRIRDLSTGSRLPLPLRTAMGGAVCGLAGLAGLRLLGTAAAALGPGYAPIKLLVAGAYGPAQATEVLAVKAVATVATLGSGAAGGIFIPIMCMGAATGVALGGLLPVASSGLPPVVGMAAFLAAAYNTPLAGAVFVAETTGSSGYIIPGLIAAALSYAVAGRVSVSTAQRWRRQERLDALLAVKVREVMTRDVTTVPPDATLDAFVTEFVVAHRRRSFPVTDAEGRLVGMVALRDVREVARDRWGATPVGSIMTADVVTVTAQDAVGSAAALMAERDVDRVPVVRPDDRRRLVGIISSTDIVGLEQLSEHWQAHA